MFLAIDFFFHLVAIFRQSAIPESSRVLVKILFFPLANKSYASMAKMQGVQPQLR